MARRLLPNELWDRVRPLLPERRVHRRGGRPPVGDRRVLTGILFVLKTGIPWEHLPEEMGCGCGMTCLRRLREWQRAGIWESIREVLAEHMPDGDQIKWSRAERGANGTDDSRRRVSDDLSIREESPGLLMVGKSKVSQARLGPAPRLGGWSSCEGADGRLERQCSH